MEQDKHTYRARLDFLYQSIAMYAATIVIYWIARSMFLTKAFPTFWQDPLLLLLSAITLISVVALGYNLFLKRQLILRPDRIEFTSRARQRTIEKKDVNFVQFGRELSENRRAIRTVKISLKYRKRPVRIRLLNFERSKRLLNDLREWAGPLATERQLRRPGAPKLIRRNRGGHTAEGEGRAAL